MAASIFERESEVDIYGDLPDFVIEEMEVDKLGVLVATVRVPRAFPLQQDWLLPWKAPQFFGGVPCSKIRAGLQDRDGICNLVYHFEGVSDSENFSFPADQAQCEIDCQTASAAITTHARFLLLAKKYGAKFNPADKDDFWYFGKTLPKAAQGDIPYDPDNTLGIKSPLYGTDSFEAPRLIYRRTYLTTSLPDSLVNDVGYIDDSLKTSSIRGQGPPPPALKGRDNWLKASLRGTWRGNVWSLMTEWWASSNGLGWNDDIYRRTT